MLNKLYHKGAEIKSAFLNGVMVFGNSESIPETTDQGLAKDYSGTGWYKATDTGVVYNVGVPEGETHVFSDGDPTEYISVWRNEGLDPETFEGTEEEIQKLVYWYNNLHRFATSNVTDMSYWAYGYGAIEDVPVESDITNASIVNHYDTSNVTNMSLMFAMATTFNQPLDNFDTSNVTNMEGMFNATSFNQPLDNFDTSNVTNMEGMFNEAMLFNQDLSSWDTSNVTTMKRMFDVATAFNQDLSTWDTSKVTDMSSMFYGATSFNQDISSWDTSNVTNMSSMIRDADAFNQDLSKWCVSKLSSPPRSFDASSISWTLPRPVWGTCPRGEDGS